MDIALLAELRKLIEGDIATDSTTLAEYSHDASLFEVVPQAVVFPKTQKDISSLVKFVSDNKKDNPTCPLPRVLQEPIWEEVQ